MISEEDVLELDLPSPYFHSNIVNQPLWLASTKFGRDEIIDLYLKVISNTASVKSYSDFAQSFFRSRILLTIIGCHPSFPSFDGSIF
jgi:hypothetical protein